MADEEVDIEFDVDDKVTPKLGRMERGVQKLGKAVDGATDRFIGMVKQAAFFGAMFNLGSAINTAKGYIDHLDKISDLTGISAQRVGGISNAMEESGVEAAEVENIMARMVKRGTRLTEGNKAAADLAKKYGINLKDGPEKSLVAMSKAVVKGGLGAGEIGRALGVSEKSAAGMIDMLGKGPDEVARMIEDGTLKNAAFNDEAMAGMQAYGEATNRVGVAWKRLTAGIMVKLAPAMTVLADKFSARIGSWTEGAEKFGNFLVKHMDTIIVMAKTYAKIMLASFAIQKLSGGKMTAGGLAASAGRWVMGGKAASAAGAGGGIMSMLKGGGGAGAIVGQLGRLGLIGGAIALIVGAFKAFPEVASKIKDHFSRIFSALGKIGSSIASMFSEDSSLGRGIRWFGEKVMGMFEMLFGGIASVIEWLADRVERLVNWETKHDQKQRRQEEHLDKVGAVSKIYGEKARLLEAHKGKVTDKERMAFREAERAMAEARKLESTTALPTSAKRIAEQDARMANLRKKFGGQLGGDAPNKADVYQDFRGSRFDIEQKFAEGFDPDRIAVAFANDISSIGERKLQSGFSPLFTVR